VWDKDGSTTLIAGRRIWHQARRYGVDIRRDAESFMGRQICITAVLPWTNSISNSPTLRATFFETIDIR
jgi:hypothetical protein